MFERLTRIDAGGIITGAKRGRGEYVGTQEMLERLYEYENSNLSPEEVQSLAQAKAEGRLIELPCKIGDTVYVIYGKSKILETKVDLRFWNDDDGWILRTKEGLFYEKYIGKPYSSPVKKQKRRWRCGRR